MGKKILNLRLATCLLFLFVLSAIPSYADEAMLLEKIEKMESRINELESRLDSYKSQERRNESKMEKVENKIEEISGTLANTQEKIETARPPAVFEGIEIGAGATFVYQTTNNANGDDLSENGEDVGDASYSVDLELSKEFDDFGKALLLFEAGEGSDVEDELKVFSNVNFDATGGDSNLGIVEGWYEQYIGSATLRFGKLDATYLIDSNEYANDECTQFLGRIFRNSPVIEFPDNSGGVRLAFAPTKFMEIETLSMDGNADWEDLFDDTFYAGQVNFKPKFMERGGNYRFFSWASDREHTKWDDSTETKEKNYGFGLSFDQELTDVIGIFARYAWQNPEVYLNGESYSLEQAFSVGMQVAGEPWGRDEDVLGIAFGQVLPSDDYKDSNSSLKADTEGHVELYYSYKINDHLTVSPDVQVIWKPYGGDATNGDDTIVVGGLRGQVDF